jgi:integrase
LWAPDVARAAEPPTSRTFHLFAWEWLEARRPELRESTIADYSWQLSNHLLPFFTDHRLPQITVAEVDRYRDFKVRERNLSAESINKTITRLGQILAVAEECDLIPRNPVRVNTRNRKLKTKRKRPVFLESAEQIAAMIDTATELDANRRRAPPAAGRSSRRWSTPACGSARRQRCAGATSTSPTDASPSATRRPRPASGSSTSSRRSATS